METGVEGRRAFHPIAERVEMAVIDTIDRGHLSAAVVLRFPSIDG
jgi:hypothetical protein